MQLHTYLNDLAERRGKTALPARVTVHATGASYICVYIEVKNS